MINKEDIQILEEFIDMPHFKRNFGGGRIDKIIKTMIEDIKNNGNMNEEMKL